MSAIADAALALLALRSAVWSCDLRDIAAMRARALDCIAALPADLRGPAGGMGGLERDLLEVQELGAVDLENIEAALVQLGFHALVAATSPASACTPCCPPPSSGSEWADEMAAASAETAGSAALEDVEPADSTRATLPSPDMSLPGESAPGEAAGVVDIDVDFGAGEPSRPFELVRRGSALDSLLHG